MTRLLPHLAATALATAQTEAAELRAENERLREARVKELMTLLHGVGGLLETNVRTKARDDHAEQKMIVLIRAALAQGTQPHE